MQADRDQKHMLHAIKAINQPHNCVKTRELDSHYHSCEAASVSPPTLLTRPALGMVYRWKCDQGLPDK